MNTITQKIRGSAVPSPLHDTFQIQLWVFLNVRVAHAMNDIWIGPWAILRSHADVDFASLVIDRK